MRKTLLLALAPALTFVFSSNSSANLSSNHSARALNPACALALDKVSEKISTELLTAIRIAIPKPQDRIEVVITLHERIVPKEWIAVYLQFKNKKNFTVGELDVTNREFQVEGPFKAVLESIVRWEVTGVDLGEHFVLPERKAKTDFDLATVKKALDQWRGEIRSKDYVVSAGIGPNPPHGFALSVRVRDEASQSLIPKEYEGIPVKVSVAE